MVKMKGSLPSITVGVVFILLWTFLLFNSQLVFGDLAPFAEKQMIVYFIGFLLTITVFKVSQPELSSGLGGFVDFLMFFAITALILLPFPFIASAAGSFEFVMLALGFGVMFAFIKAFIEEAIFRKAFMSRIGNFGQAVVFGIFHATMLIGLSQAKYGQVDMIFVASGALLLATLGFVWGMIAQKYGTLASTGSHTAWNVGAFGFLPDLFSFSASS